VSVGWVAATVRARALARRRVGGAGAVAIARAPSYAAGRAALITAPNNGRVGPDDDLATAERNLAESLLWHLRVLSGWLPPDGGGQVRALAAVIHLLASTLEILAADPRWAIPSLALIDIWFWTPCIALIISAGLQTIPEEIVESARLDIRQPALSCLCVACGARSEVDALDALCPRCASREVTFDGGRELVLESIELEDPTP
jgi:hypothetical protein